MDDKGMRKAGLLVNPLSGKSSGRGLALAEKLKGVGSISIEVLTKFADLEPALHRLAERGVTDLFISSGDGTIQAIQTAIAEGNMFSTMPRLALLPHGTTNMTAADLGFRQKSVDAQANYMRELSTGRTSQRPTLRAVNPADGRPRHGMFLGTGAVSEATLFCQRAFNARGVKGNTAVLATLAPAIARTIFTKPDPKDPNRFDRPFDISVSANGRSLSQGPQLLMLATTLDKLILGAKPFWGGKVGAIRTTIFPYPVPSILRWLLPILYGSEDRRAPPGAISHSAESFTVSSPVSYVIDGEFFEGPRDEPLRLETGPVFTYLCG